MEQHNAWSPEQAYYMAHVANPALAKITAALLVEQPDADKIDAFIIKLLSAPNLPPAKASSIELLHFNDVYNIEPSDRDPVGGAARFVTLIKNIRSAAAAAGNAEPIVVFSGDAFNPSLMSTVTKGKQMVPCLNNMKIDVACIGNHDLDFGIDNLESLIAETKFPWLMSNVKYLPDGQNLAGGETYVVVERGGRRLGFIGLVEMEWMTTLSTVEESDIEFEDFVACARRLAPMLRDVHKCDAVIAVTHMRVPNDERLARECGDILNLIAGGHDHHYDVKPVAPHGCYVLKSGTDFKDLTRLTLAFDDLPNGTCKVRVENVVREAVVKSIAEDPETKECVDEFLNILGSEMDKTIGFTNVPLEGRFVKVRTEETNLGNFIADLMRHATSADVAILNSGTLRSDCVLPAGNILMKDLVAILPMCDSLVVLEVTGAQLRIALENGVSQYPRLEGRFPQVSGVSFTFDANLPPNSRIVGDIKVGGHVALPDATFKVVLKEYMSKGKDGYNVLADCKTLVDSEHAPILATTVRNAFTELSIVNLLIESKSKKSVVRGPVEMRRAAFLPVPEHVAAMAHTPELSPSDSDNVGVSEPNGDAHSDLIGSIGSSPKPMRRFSTSSVEMAASKLKDYRRPISTTYGINPICEDRIVCLNKST
jgi:5'-nucleotidase